MRPTGIEGLASHGHLGAGPAPMPGDGLGRSEEDEIAQHLRGLGYIE